MARCIKYRLIYELVLYAALYANQKTLHLRGNTVVQETGTYGAYLVYETINSFRN